MPNSFSTMTLTSLFLLLLISSLHVVSTVAKAAPEPNHPADKVNSIAPKAYLVRYWNRQITNNLPKPSVLFSRASPLTAASAAIFAKLVAQGAISDHLLSFCEEAQLLCFPNSSLNGVAATDALIGYHGNSGYALGKTDALLGYHGNSQYTVGKTDALLGYHGNSEYAAGVDAVAAADDKKVNGGVEPGKFFRESILKSGNVMPMPDLQDNMPRRSFLPRRISSELPFSTSKLAELKQIFHATENSSMEKIMAHTLDLCEATTLQDETKRCVASIEDMIDLATSVLGHDVMVRSTESAGGSKQEVLVGAVKRIEGSKVSDPVVCHQTLFPYIIYYCHTFPNVRVYEADILDLKSKAKINHGVAICHMDTSTWSPTHESFLLLGSGPGRIEVCHWTYENNVIWTAAK